jgi:protein ImuB
MFACVFAPQPTIDLSAIAEAFSPSFEQTTPGTIVFKIDNLRRLYSSHHQIAQAIIKKAGPDANVAIAETADAAILAAHNFRGISISPNLAQLNIASLPMEQEMWEVLESWGIHTLAELAALPETGIAERFGPAGVNLQRLARGAINRPLKIFKPEVTYQDRISLDHAVTLLEPLLFLIARILNDQCDKLLSHAMSANEITIRLELEDKTEHIRTLRLPVPMRESKSLLKLLQMDLEAHPPQAATLALSVTIKPVHPRTIQAGIFLPITPAPDKLELTLARIRSIVGESNVGTPQLLNTHHPNPFQLVTHQPPATSHQPPTTRHAFRYFRPPIPARIELQNHRPTRVTAANITGKIQTAAGPWRTTGDWWTTTPWNRDEWDITLSNSTLYRIYREPTDHWFIEGTYD